MAMIGLVDDFGQMQLLDGRTGFMEMLLYSIPHSTRIACAFLSKEMTESFIWMFEEFKKTMPSGEPTMIIIDQDAAMTRAISIAFPTTFHRLCIWHIISKFSVKLPHSAYKEY
ncbi:unnamed protein product [Prunus armeniaca]